MGEVFLFHDKESEDVKELHAILTKNYSLNIVIRSNNEAAASVESLIDTVRETTLAIYCLTNQFVKSDEFMKLFDATKKYKKQFLLVKLDEIVVKNVKLVAVLFDEKKSFDFCASLKDKERRPRLLYHPRLQDFIKAVSSCVNRQLDHKFKEPKAVAFSNAVDNSNRHMEGPDKSIKNLIQNFDNLAAQISQLNIQNTSLDKALKFIKAVLMNDAQLDELHDTEKLKKLEAEIVLLQQEVLDNKNLISNLTEKINELKSENFTQKDEIEYLKNCLHAAEDEIECLSKLGDEDILDTIEAEMKLSVETVIRNDKYIEKHHEDDLLLLTATTTKTEQAYESLMKEIVYEIHHPTASNHQEEFESGITESTSLESVESCNSKNIRSHKCFNLGSGLVARMTLLNENEILAIDNERRLIHVLDMNADENQTIRTVSPKAQNGESLLQMPINILKTAENKIYVTNYCKSSLLVFDLDLQFLKEIEFEIDGFKAIDFLDVDDTNANHIYLVDYESRKVSILDLETLKVVGSIEDVEPWNIKAKSNKIFLVSLTVWDWEDRDRKVFKAICGGKNCIYAIEKNDLSSRKMITFDHWLRPEGLHVDDSGHVFTTAFKIDPENSIISDYRFLFIINQESELIREIYLSQIFWFHDFLVFKNKFLFSGADGPKEEQWIKVFEIDCN